MAKKSGMSLNPGADATLVAAATKAAMANVPKDLSGTFEALASNYATTMQSVADSYKEVAKNVGSLGRSAVDQAVTNLNNRAVVAGVSNKTNTTFLTDGLKDVKKNIYSTWKLRNEDGSINNPLSALNRSKRIEARQQRDKFFGQAKSITAGSTFLSENFANGTVDEKATGPRNLMLANGIQSLSTSSGKSEDGSYLKPSHDRDKNIIFTLYGADDKPITGFVNGKPVSIDGEEGVSVATDKINGLITPKNAEVASGFNTLMTNMETNAKNSNTNATFDNFAPKLKNDMRPLVDTEDKLHSAMHASIYNFSETFADDLHNPEGSVTSATIFGMMGNTIPQDADGNPLPVDEMADGKAGITAADFTTGEAGAANYKMITNALTNKSNKFYDYDTTKEVFLGWAEQGAETAFNYGAGQRKGAVGKTDGLKTDTNPYGIPKDGLRLGDPMPNGYQIEVRQDLVTGYINDIKAGGEFSFLQNDYSYVDGNWYENYGTKPNEDGEGGELKYDSTQAMTDDVFQTGGKYFDGLETKIQIDPKTGEPFKSASAKTTASKKAGVVSTWSPTIDMEFVNRDDNVVATALQDLMPTAFDLDGNPLGYKFMNLKTVGALTGKIETMGDFTKEAVGLYSDDGKTHITYPKGHEKDIDENGNPGGGKIPVIIFLGSDETTRRKAIATINAITNTPEFQIGKPKLK